MRRRRKRQPPCPSCPEEKNEDGIREGGTSVDGDLSGAQKDYESIMMVRAESEMSKFVARAIDIYGSCRML